MAVPPADFEQEGILQFASIIKFSLTEHLDISA